MATVALPHSAEAQIVPLGFTPSSVPIGASTIGVLLTAYGTTAFAFLGQNNVGEKA
jgi:hypothetical protein